MFRAKSGRSLFFENKREQGRGGSWEENVE